MAEELESIKFNVGGNTYEVSRSLLDQFPNTMIARAASEMWNKKTRSKDKPIFIDRNGDRFAYVLDNMRDNKIQLPITVSKEGLIDDMHYYGFDNIDSISITVNIPMYAFHTQSNSIEDMYNKKIQEMEMVVKAHMDAAEEQVKDIKKEITVMRCARDCFLVALEKRSTSFLRYLPSNIDINNQEDKVLVEKHLNMVGLSGRICHNSQLVLEYYTPK
jgi:hypothetical protein